MAAETLGLDLGKDLERAVVAAREAAEAGEKASLGALAMLHSEPYDLANDRKRDSNR